MRRQGIDASTANTNVHVQFSVKVAHFPLAKTTRQTSQLSVASFSVAESRVTRMREHVRKLLTSRMLDRWVTHLQARRVSARQVARALVCSSFSGLRAKRDCSWSVCEGRAKPGASAACSCPTSFPGSLLFPPPTLQLERSNKYSNKVVTVDIPYLFYNTPSRVQVFLSSDWVQTT